KPVPQHLWGYAVQWRKVESHYGNENSHACVRQRSGFLTLNSCDTPVGQGAAWGAATGAIIGGAATGHVRAASIGAAAGAAAGALTGAMIQENQAARYGPPPGGFPYARWAGTPGFYYSPYTGRVYNLRGIPPVDLRVTSIPAAFSAHPNCRINIGSARLRLECIHQRSCFISHLQQFWPGTVIIFAGQFAR